jgi:tricorn protease
VYFDLEAREEQTVVGDADAFRLSANGEKLLVANGGQYDIVDVAPEQSMDTPLKTDEMSVTVDPRAEWRQIFADVWRFQRDFFYDPNMHGVDWDQMRERYGPLVEEAATRSDVNFLIGQLIAELNASHTYRGGGDTETPERRAVGLLGVDWALEDGAYRIDRIVEGAPWDVDTRSPLRRPGLDVEAGDYVLAVNGVPLDPDRAPWAALEGHAGETVELTVHDEPTREGARTVLVETMTSDDRLRYLDWINQKRERVAAATDGRVGYVYVPNTGFDGQTELVRQFRAQFEKEALIIDERFNSGGQIPDRFVELLNRPPMAFYAVRDGTDWQWPPVAHFGPQTMLINGWSGSGGDAFPTFFDRADRGPLIGTRTWGGLIGISGAPTLVDGGAVTVPTFRQYGPDGEWFPEGRGVTPDIRVENTPAPLARGEDPQLRRAIQEMTQALEDYTPVQPERPPYEDRTPSGSNE